MRMQFHLVRATNAFPDMLLRHIAIPAENLKVFRVSSPFKPFVKMSRIKYPTVLLAITVHVVNRQKARIGFSATSAVPTIMLNNFEAEFPFVLSPVCIKFGAISLKVGGLVRRTPLARRLSRTRRFAAVVTDSFRSIPLIGYQPIFSASGALALAGKPRFGVTSETHPIFNPRPSPSLLVVTSFLCGIFHKLIVSHVSRISNNVRDYLIQLDRMILEVR